MSHDINIINNTIGKPIAMLNNTIGKPIAILVPIQV